MSVQWLQIVGRTRPRPTSTAAVTDFALQDHSPLACAALAPALASGRCSPYCIDAERSAWLCTETTQRDFAKLAPFYYYAQYLAAENLVHVPYADAEQLLANTQLPKALTFVLGVGRCGSTLVSKLFQTGRDVVSLSEPDVFTNVQDLRLQGLSDQAAGALLASALRWLALVHPCEHLVIKLRGSSAPLAALIQHTFPNARLLFTYRNPVECVGSYVRVFGAEAVNEELLSASLPDVETRRALLATGRPASALLWWLQGVMCYLRDRTLGVSYTALRYEDWRDQPEALAKSLLTEFNVPLPTPDLLTALLSRDAQAGTALAANGEAATLSDEEGRAVRAFIYEHSTLGEYFGSDTDRSFELPGTLLPS